MNMSRVDIDRTDISCTFEARPNEKGWSASLTWLSQQQNSFSIFSVAVQNLRVQNTQGLQGCSSGTDHTMNWYENKRLC